MLLTGRWNTEYQEFESSLFFNASFVFYLYFCLIRFCVTPMTRCQIMWVIWYFYTPSTETPWLGSVFFRSDLIRQQVEMGLSYSALAPQGSVLITVRVIPCPSKTLEPTVFFPGMWHWLWTVAGDKPCSKRVDCLCRLLDGRWREVFEVRGFGHTLAATRRCDKGRGCGKDLRRYSHGKPWRNLVRLPRTAK